MAIPEVDFASRIRPDQSAEIAAARSLRERAIRLRSKANRGHYDDTDAQEYWGIIGSSNLVLRASNSQLSERAGLGPRFFSTAGGRRPKLANMLRALGVVIDVAGERLADVESATRNQGGDTWVANPLWGSPAASDLRQQIESLILQLKTSNSLSTVPELDSLWRADLIARLETLLVLLRAPLIDRTFVQKTGSLMKVAAAKLADYSIGAVVGIAITEVATSLLNLPL